MCRTPALQGEPEQTCRVGHKSRCPAEFGGSRPCVPLEQRLPGLLVAAKAQARDVFRPPALSLALMVHAWTHSSLILRRMKGLALEAESELERQDEALDGIAAAVDRATLTIDKHNRRMKRLT
ncbi:PREDICTED: uncharacterized protein LOC108534622 [Rhinopithecus bieti]|uniref:uncharacterized protein LOC108534622 n=1 Tax=Rhinopithecus bieti TaxID=61621 RepID=UPI00083C15EB|nr:PREDICTED: uncharacterized protein LOC108534622 [Rhinopithecus bieti]